MPLRCLSGVRAAEQIIDTIYSPALWLRQEELIPLDTCIAPPRWRRQLKDEWQAITGAVTNIHRPRHTQDEMRRIYDVLANPEAPVDPRIRLAIEIGAELRIGQVLASKRSQLLLTKVDGSQYESLYENDLDRAQPIGVLGRIEVYGRGKKNGETIVFTPEQRRAIDHALLGYLRLYEAQYLRDGTDYYLFPARRLVRGIAEVVPSPTYAEKTGALK